MHKILVLHGPNLNLLGTREPNIYGSLTLAEIDQGLVQAGEEAGLEVRTLQSNHEGALIDALQEARGWASGVIFNPGGYSHTSVALRDAIASIDIPVIEVHLSNVFARESFRRESYFSDIAVGVISGLGPAGYELALDYALRHARKG